MIDGNHVDPFTRVFWMLVNGETMFAFLCAILLCAVFQITLLYRAKKREGSASLKHFIWVYVFLLYITIVYRMTGTVTIWNIIYRMEISRQFAIPVVDTSRVFLVPFIDSGIVPYLYNILMTMPLGFFLAFIWPQFRSIKNIALAGFFLSLAIEISQLFSIRATMLDDIIGNTLGAVLGYLLFSWMHGVYKNKIQQKNKRNVSTDNIDYKDNADKEKINELHSFVIKYEAIFYLILSFVGITLFFNTNVYYQIFPSPALSLEDIRGRITIENKSESIIYGNVIEISNNEILINKTRIIQMDEDDQEKFISTTDIDTPNVVSISFTEELVVEVWQNDGIDGSFVSEATVDDISINDSIEVHGFLRDTTFYAQKIMIWTFD